MGTRNQASKLLNIPQLADWVIRRWMAAQISAPSTGFNRSMVSDVNFVFGAYSLL